MKRVKKVLTLLAAAALMAASVHADALKGQKQYLKHLKPKFQMNGTKFAAQHTQDEWEELFEDKGGSGGGPVFAMRYFLIATITTS